MQAVRDFKSVEDTAGHLQNDGIWTGHEVSDAKFCLTAEFVRFRKPKSVGVSCVMKRLLSV